MTNQSIWSALSPSWGRLMASKMERRIQVLMRLRRVVISLAL